MVAVSKMLAKYFTNTIQANSRIVRLISQELAREHKILLCDVLKKVNTHVLYAVAVDGRGENFIKNLYYKDPKFVREVLLAARLNSDVKLHPVVETRSEADLENAYARYYQQEIQHYIQPDIAQILTHKEVTTNRVLFAYHRDSIVHIYYEDRRGLEWVQAVFKSNKIRSQICRAANLPLEMADRLHPEYHQLFGEQLDHQIRQAFSQELERIGPDRKKIQELSTGLARDLDSHQRVVTDHAKPPKSAVQDILETIAFTGYEAGASDIHIYYSPQNQEIHYDLMREGRVVSMDPFPLHSHEHWQHVVNNIYEAAGLQNKDRHLPKNGRIDFNYHNKEEFTCRMGLMGKEVPGFRHMYVPLIVFRILRAGDKVRSIHELGMQQFDWQYIRFMVDLRNGLVFLVGPVGSGKSEFLGAYLEYQKGVDPDRTIVSLENPIEKPLPHVHQIPVWGDDPTPFLNTALRMRVNTIAPGEVNSEAMADVAVEGAATSSKVISTLHCSDPFEAPKRLQTLGVKPGLYATVLKLVTTMRLLRVNCPRCSVRENFMKRFQKDGEFAQRWKYLPDALEFWGIDPAAFEFSRGIATDGNLPCPECSFKGKSFGTKGETVALESWPAYHFKDELYADLPDSTLRRLAFSSYSHRTLYQSSMHLVAAQKVSLDSVHERLGPLEPMIENLPGHITQTARSYPSPNADSAYWQDQFDYVNRKYSDLRADFDALKAFVTAPQGPPPPEAKAPPEAASPIDAEFYDLDGNDNPQPD